MRFGRRYAGLFFTICVDVNDNELASLEAIHLFVEVSMHVLSLMSVCKYELAVCMRVCVLSVCVCVKCVYVLCVCVLMYGMCITACVCMCVCLYSCIYACVCVCMCVCARVCIRIRQDMHNACKKDYTHTHTHKQILDQYFGNVCEWILFSISRTTYKHTYIHTYIHKYTQILDQYFGNVCELDLVFNFHKVFVILDEYLLSGNNDMYVCGIHVCVLCMYTYSSR